MGHFICHSHWFDSTKIIFSFCVSFNSRMFFSRARNMTKNEMRKKSKYAWLWQKSPHHVQGYASVCTARHGAGALFFAGFTEAMRSNKYIAPEWWDIINQSDGWLRCRLTRLWDRLSVFTLFLSFQSITEIIQFSTSASKQLECGNSVHCFASDRSHEDCSDFRWIQRHSPMMKCCTIECDK